MEIDKVRLVVQVTVHVPAMKGAVAERLGLGGREKRQPGVPRHSALSARVQSCRTPDQLSKHQLSSTLAFLSHRRELIQQGIPVTAR